MFISNRTKIIFGSTAIVVEGLENCTLEDDTIEDADDSKCDENETSVEPQEKKPTQESNQFMEPLNSPEEQKHGVSCNLAACLREFMSSETLTGKNKFGCEFCSKAHFSETKNDVVSNENGANKRKNVFRFGNFSDFFFKIFQNFKLKLN